jgi:hypothetical protein
MVSPSTCLDSSVLEDHVDISSFDPTALIMRWIYVDEGDSTAGGRLATFPSIQIREAASRAGVATTEGSYPHRVENAAVARNFPPIQKKKGRIRIGSE